MAEDALRLADHLGWQRFHLAGHSMGAMIACKLAAAQPRRIASLALISTSNGGYDMIPTVSRDLVKGRRTCCVRSRFPSMTSFVWCMQAGSPAAKEGYIAGPH